MAIVNDCYNACHFHVLVFDATSFQPMKRLPMYSTLLQVCNGKGAFKELPTDIVNKEIINGILNMM